MKAVIFEADIALSSYSFQELLFLHLQPSLFIPLFLTKNQVLGKYKGIEVKIGIRSWQAFQQGLRVHEFSEWLQESELR